MHIGTYLHRSADHNSGTVIALTGGDNNDVVIFALPGFDDSKLNDGDETGTGWDISWQFKFFGGVSRPFRHQEPWGVRC